VLPGISSKLYFAVSSNLLHNKRYFYSGLCMREGSEFPRLELESKLKFAEILQSAWGGTGEAAQAKLC